MKTGFTERLATAIRDVYVPEIRSDLEMALQEALAIARQHLDRQIRLIMDEAIKSITDLVTVRIAPGRIAGVDIQINYPIPKEDAK